MNNIFKYFLLFATSTISNKNLESIENNYNNPELNITLNITNLQNEIDEMIEPKLIKSKITFFSLISLNIAIGLLGLSYHYHYDNLNYHLSISGLISLCSSLYCIFNEFSNYAYIPLIMNPFLINWIRYTSKNIKYGIILAIICGIIPNSIKGYMHKKKIEFKKIKALKIKQLEELKNTY